MKWAVFFLALAGVGRAQDVQLSFLPPPLENATYSLGIYAYGSGKLIRHLHEIAPEGAFTVGLNGFITKWDGKDDAGTTAPPGRYAARGYAVGPLKVAGIDILGNDWTSEDETLRVKSIEALALRPSDDSLLLLAALPGAGRDILQVSTAGKLVARKPATGDPDLDRLQAAGDKLRSAGKDGTTWLLTDNAEPADLHRYLVQQAVDGTILRKLEVAPGDPAPAAVCASTREDRLYLLEVSGRWQRVRGLSWVENKEEDGKQISTWQTFFERNIRPPEAGLGLEQAAVPVEIGLAENPLTPGKLQKIRLTGGFDKKGSYLATVDGLRLRRISQRENLETTKLVASKSGLTFFQSDGAAWDEFSIGGASNMMAFDAGEFEWTATGEKAPEPKPTEPPDL